MPKVQDDRGSKTRSRRPTTGASTTPTPFRVEGGGAEMTVAVLTGEMETVVDMDKADAMRGGAAWDGAVARGFVDTCVGRPTREDNGVAATLFRDEEYAVFKCRNAVLMWPSGLWQEASFDRITQH